MAVKAESRFFESVGKTNHTKAKGAFDFLQTKLWVLVTKQLTVCTTGVAQSKLVNALACE